MRRPRARRVLTAPFRAAGWTGRRVGGRGTRLVGRGFRLVGRGAAWSVRGLRGTDEAARARRAMALTTLVWTAAAASAAIAFGTTGTVYDTDRMGWGPAPFIGILVGLPLVLVVTRPMLGWAVSAGSAFVLAVLLPVRGDLPWPWLVMHGLVLLTLLFAVCARERADRAVGAWLFTAGLFAWGVADDVRGGWLVGVSMVAVLGSLAGRLVRTRRALTRQKQVASAEKAQRVVLQERARIARDLHDIVAHHMSLIVVQAETAQYRVPDLSGTARAELASISDSARSALAETRALLAVLRQEDDPAERAPQPGLAAVADLADAARRAGLAVEVERSGEVSRLRPGTSLAGYRIVQEALANAARHAPGAAVRISVAVGEEAVEVAVRSGPVPGAVTGAAPAQPTAQPPVQPPVQPEGHGITGMRERVAAESGELSAGPTQDGGFAVTAWLPVAARPAVGAVSR